MSTETETSTSEAVRDEESSLRRVLVQFTDNRIAMFGLGLLGLLLIVTLAADLIAPFSPNEQNYDAVLVGPSMEHPMGTDELGRDIFSRVLYGYQTIFSITVGGVLMSFAVGTMLGLAAGYYGRWLDETLMRTVDVLMSFPSLILALALIAAIGPSKWGIALVLGIAYTPIFARVARSESVSLSNETFIRSLEVRGVSTPRILVAHMFPNILGPLIVTFTLQLAFGILTTATLSFLGVGVQPPEPSLGLMLSNGKDMLDTAWWMSIFPGIAIMLPVIAFNTIGDGLRDTFDPKQVRN